MIPITTTVQCLYVGKDRPFVSYTIANVAGNGQLAHVFPAKSAKGSKHNAACFVLFVGISSCTWLLVIVLPCSRDCARICYMYCGLHPYDIWHTPLAAEGMCRITTGSRGGSLNPRATRETLSTAVKFYRTQFNRFCASISRGAGKTKQRESYYMSRIITYINRSVCGTRRKSFSPAPEGLLKVANIWARDTKNLELGKANTWKSPPT